MADDADYGSVDDVVANFVGDNLAKPICIIIASKTFTNYGR